MARQLPSSFVCRGLDGLFWKVSAELDGAFALFKSEPMLISVDLSVALLHIAMPITSSNYIYLFIGFLPFLSQKAGTKIDHKISKRYK